MPLRIPHLSLEERVEDVADRDGETQTPEVS